MSPRKPKKSDAPRCASCDVEVDEDRADRCDACRAPLCNRCAMQGQWEAQTLCEEHLQEAIAQDVSGVDDELADGHPWRPDDEDEDDDQDDEGDQDEDDAEVEP